MALEMRTNSTHQIVGHFFTTRHGKGVDDEHV